MTNDPLDLEEWRTYEALVHQSIVAAEQHLEVPAGTISSIPNDPDFIAIVKMYAVIEPILNELIASRPPQGTFPALPIPQSEVESYRTFVTALNVDGGRTGKLKLAEGLGLLTKTRVAFIRGVAQVRNRYAHNVKNMHRSLCDMLLEVERNNASIVEHLTGIQAPAPDFIGSQDDRDISDLLKRFMYFRLADYLSEALHTLQPPPPPPNEGGLLGMLGTPPPTIENK